ncbi:hypothetical protein, partial [Pseudomonas syringae group genomosp. 7]|uniref:hypothetical protein n=1 Tax=Pseudomonas syringae group genomosp. 7 TaxID=251699 RepID=UPI00376FC9E9
FLWGMCVVVGLVLVCFAVVDVLTGLWVLVVVLFVCLVWLCVSVLGFCGLVWVGGCGWWGFYCLRGGLWRVVVLAGGGSRRDWLACRTP